MSNKPKNTPVSTPVSTPPVPSAPIEKKEIKINAPLVPALDVDPAKIAQSKAAAGVLKVSPTVDEVIAENQGAKKEYNSYVSALVSTQMITKFGRRIRFTDKLFITKDPALIEYLDEEIANGNQYISKGEMVDTAERDPMAVLRAKHFKEFKEMQAEEARNKALGITKDMGNTGAKTGLNPLSTGNTAS